MINNFQGNGRKKSIEMQWMFLVQGIKKYLQHFKTSLMADVSSVTPTQGAEIEAKADFKY